MVPVTAGMTLRRRAEPRQGPIAASSSRSCSLERPVGAVTVRLDPAPAAETVAAGDSGDVADPGRTHHLVPARRAGEITARLGVEASGRVRAAGEEVLRRIVAPCVLELQRSRDCWAKVVLGEAAERQERLRVGERPAPAIETDRPLQLGDGLEAQRVAIQAGLAESLE